MRAKRRILCEAGLNQPAGGLHPSLYRFLLKPLVDWITRLSYRFRWVGEFITIWENFATVGYTPHYRKMYRITCDNAIPKLSEESLT